MSTIPVKYHRDVIDFIEAVADHPSWYWVFADENNWPDDMVCCAGCDVHMPVSIFVNIIERDDDEVPDTEAWLFEPTNHESYCTYRKAKELLAVLGKEMGF